MQALAERYIDFISQCKTERECITYARDRLLHYGFSEVIGNEKFFSTLHEKTIFIVRKGKLPLSAGLRFIGAHADTPRLDLKQRPLQEQVGVGQAKTHYYGGIRKYQWLARPLAIHGVVVLQDGTVTPVVIGEVPGDPVFCISDLLPHLALNQVEMTVSKAFEGERLNLIFGHKPVAGDKGGADGKAGMSVNTSSGPTMDGTESENEKKEPIKAHMLRILQQKYGIVEEDLFSAELQAVPAGAARFVGLDSALIGGYGHDDRICLFSALEALLEDPNTIPEHTQCLTFWDKEEIGSEGSASSKSRFFEYCILDLLAAWEPETHFSTLMLATKAISADVHAAIDPDWQELHDRLNSATIGHGPCFCKFTGHQGKFSANDAHPEYIAWLRSLLNGKGIPWQFAELGKVDGGGSGTVAMHMAAYGMNVIDCGPSVLSMHSPFELASKADLYATTLAYGAFLQS